jgi:hypothetical protein
MASDEENCREFVNEKEGKLIGCINIVGTIFCHVCKVLL